MAAPANDVTIDIICSVLNGERFLPELLESLSAQTHARWRLWLRDDGSSDATVSLIQTAAARDSRISVLHVGGPRLGVAQAYGWLLERVPPDSEYVMVADADDVWLADKIERTLRAMRDAELNHGRSTPLLVHTDLTVVDEKLREIHPSFWAFTAARPEPASLRRYVVRNPATAPTIMANAALRKRIGRTPPEAIYQDWWYAAVAAAVGHVVALHESTVLYRQHGANDVGAAPRGPVSLRRLPAAVRNAIRRTEQYRAGVAKTAAQARVILERYGSELTEDDRNFLRDYSAIPARSALGRKMTLLRLRAVPELDVWRRIGAVLRA